MPRARGWRAQRRRQAWARGSLLAACVFILAAPVAWTMLASFEIKPDGRAPAPGWTWPPSAESYVEIMTRIPGFPRVVGTSLLLATAAAALTVGAAFPSAYSLARWSFRGRRLLAQAFLVLARLLPVTSCFRFAPPE